jgi:hypothetical protein
LHTPLWKECLNSDGHQQNGQSPLIPTELTEQKKKTTTYDVRNPGPGLGQAQKYAQYLKIESCIMSSGYFLMVHDYDISN